VQLGCRSLQFSCLVMCTVPTATPDGAGKVADNSTGQSPGSCTPMSADGAPPVLSGKACWIRSSNLVQFCWLHLTQHGLVGSRSLSSRCSLSGCCSVRLLHTILGRAERLCKPSIIPLFPLFIPTHARWGFSAATRWHTDEHRGQSRHRYMGTNWGLQLLLRIFSEIPR
jgi:hypothetical protein